MRFTLRKDAKKFIIFGSLLFFGIIFSSLIFAGFQTGTPSNYIEKTYGSSFDISGWINISFDEEPANSVFSSFFNDEPGETINLEELLEKSPSYEYSCIPFDCEKDYSTTGGEDSKGFTLNSNGSKILGLKISSSEPIESVSSFSMKVNSNAAAASTSQLTIDILNDNEIDWIAHKPLDEYQEKNYGCFEESEAEGWAEITTSQYCQRISLPAFPQVRLGANIEERSGGDADFILSISNDTLGIYSSCTQNLSSSGQVECVVPNLKTNESLDFFVCIRTTNEEDSNKYKLRHEQKNPCGFTDFFEGEYNYDFEIFAQPSLYDAVGNFILNNTEMQESGSFGAIEDKILNYINEKYGGDCSNGCVIPIVFWSDVDGQAMVVSDIGLSYVAGISTTTTKIYNLMESFAKINSDYQRLFIDKAGFSVPDELGEYSFSLKLNEQEILSENIEIKDVPIIKSLTPKTTAVGYPETFEIDVTSPPNVNISSYYWDFGDGSNITTSINKAVHIYSAIDSYDLRVTVTDTRGFNSSKTFEIDVTSAEELVENTINEMDATLSHLEEDIEKYDAFQKTGLKSVLRIENISSELEISKQRLDNVTSESEYMPILEELLKIKLPKNIIKTKQANSVLFYPEKDNVDVDVVESIGGGSYDTSMTENYKQAIAAWQQENVELTMDFTEFSGEYDSGITPIANIFEISVNEKKDIAEDYYFIIPKLQNSGFSRATEESGDFDYFELSDVSKVNFYTAEDVDFATLPAFVAPPISALSVSSTSFPPVEKPKVLIFILILIFLIILGIIAYIILYYWYKRKYEDYLFRNRNDLYNIVTYVNDSKKKGLDNKEIARNLRKAGWSSEQIRYVMRKYEGKRTGLVELPLMPLMKKVKEMSSGPKPQRGHLMKKVKRNSLLHEKRKK